MLRDYVETPLSAEQIGDLLTMTGFELEDIEEVNGEAVLDVNIMANRGDGASLIGMAREVLAKSRESKPTELYIQATKRFPALFPELPNPPASIAIESEDCSRFAARVVTGIKNGSSPQWVQDRLTKIGQRPISLLVDLTNYVMIETGQPLHAYDLEKLPEGKIVVRQARAGEKLTTLDGTEHELTPDQLMICDRERPIGAAGIMGGLDTEVSDTTTSTLLEAAHFDHQSVRRTRKQLGLQTEASYRFERYVDPEQVVAALNRLTDLLIAEQPDIKVFQIQDDYPRPPKAIQLSLRPARASALLGMEVSLAECRAYLTALGCKVEENSPDALAVTPPSWRNDLLREEDLIEEVGRVHGYDRIPSAAPIGSTPEGGAFGFELLQDKIRSEVLAAGLDQMLTFSLRDLHPLDGPGKRTRVRTPHSPEIAYLRNSLLSSLADSAHRNGLRDLHIFELGRVFPESGEATHLGILSVGKFEGPSWIPTDQSSSDFYTVKGTLKKLCSQLGCSLTLAESSDSRLHPTRQASVIIGGLECGVMGQIHPNVAEEAGLLPETMLAEIDLEKLRELPTGQRSWHSISRHPGTRRDIAIVVPKTVSFAQIEDSVRRAAGPVLESMSLFDVYEGKGIPEGQHSLAIGIDLRKPDSTFTDEEANQVRDSVVAALVELGAQLR